MVIAQYFKGKLSDSSSQIGAKHAARRQVHPAIAAQIAVPMTRQPCWSCSCCPCRYLPAEIVMLWTGLRSVLTAVDLTDDRRQIAFAVAFFVFLPLVMVHVGTTVAKELREVPREAVVAAGRVRDWNPTLVQMALSLLAFMIFAMSVGPPFSGWGVTAYQPYLTAGTGAVLMIVMTILSNLGMVPTEHFPRKPAAV